MAIWAYYVIILYGLGEDFSRTTIAGTVIAVLVSAQVASFIICGVLKCAKQLTPLRWIVCGITLLHVIPVVPTMGERDLVSSFVLLALSSALCASILLWKGLKQNVGIHAPLVYWCPVAVFLFSIPWYLDQTRYMIS